MVKMRSPIHSTFEVLVVQCVVSVVMQKHWVPCVDQYWLQAL